MTSSCNDDNPAPDDDRSLTRRWWGPWLVAQRSVGAPESAGPLRKVAGALRIFGVLLDVNLHFTG